MSKEEKTGNSGNGKSQGVFDLSQSKLKPILLQRYNGSQGCTVAPASMSQHYLPKTYSGLTQQNPAKFSWNKSTSTTSSQYQSQYSKSKNEISIPSIRSPASFFKRSETPSGWQEKNKGFDNIKDQTNLDLETETQILTDVALILVRSIQSQAHIESFSKSQYKLY